MKKAMSVKPGKKGRKIGRNKEKGKLYRGKRTREVNKERKLTKRFNKIIRKNPDKVYERVGNNLVIKEVKNAG